MSILTHPEWPLVARYLRVETYDRDGGHRHPRHRLEIQRPESGIDLRKLLALVMPCVGCGAPIHPVRMRASGNHCYFAVSCGLDQTYACARGARAKEEYEAIVAALAGLPPTPTPQGSLFS